MNTNQGSDVSLRRKKLPVDHAILWGPAGDGPPQVLQAPYPLFVQQTPLRHIIAHLRSEPGKSMLGILLGDLFECPESGIRYAVVRQVMRIGADVPDDRTGDILERLWPSLQEKLEAKEPNLIGWYHSHPKGSPAPTANDVAAHSTYFTQPWHVGLVVGEEGGKAAAQWFRTKQGDPSPTTLGFYELLAPDSIDASGKKRTFVVWGNFKSYKAVAPKPKAPAAAPAPPKAAAPAATPAAPKPSPPPKPKASPPPAPPAAPKPAPPAQPAAPAPPPAAAAPPRPAAAPPPPPAEPKPPPRPPVESRPEPPPPPRPSVETRPEPEPEPSGLPFIEPEPEPEPEPAPRPSQPPPRARPSFTSIRPSAPSVVPPTVVHESPAGRGQLFLGAAIGAVAVCVLVAGGWAAGMVQFGKGGAPTGGAGMPTNVAATPIGDTQPVVQDTVALDTAVGNAAAENTTSAPAPEDPALIALDLISDTVESVVAAYQQSRRSFDSDQADCTALADALVAVEEFWIAYNVRGKPRDVVLDPNRAARDRSLYARVDSVETDFDETGCARP